eukprot:Seg314.2 transcript_id=Seg314.2/GoldUCD/mRNA.D3Y31 product="Laminin subunit gamma-1" protein_id=Seg314.2/GoldUCD/D3Y31
MSLMQCSRFVLSNTPVGLVEALNSVEKLLADLGSLESLDIKKLEVAEAKFKVVNDTIVGELDREVEKLEKASKTQIETITKYELDLEPLRKKIEHVDDLFKSIPRSCLKPPPELEAG